MNKVAQAWVAALRSGEYKQTKGNLKNNNKFCCLGVMCDLQGREWHVDEWMDGMRIKTYHVNGKSRDGSTERFNEFPPPAAMETVGLTRDQAGILADMNDSGATFKQIAKEIEGMLE